MKRVFLIAAILPLFAGPAAAQSPFTPKRAEAPSPTRTDALTQTSLQGDGAENAAPLYAGSPLVGDSALPGSTLPPPPLGTLPGAGGHSGASSASTGEAPQPEHSRAWVLKSRPIACLNGHRLFKQGSELVVLDETLAKELGIKINKEVGCGK